MKVTIQPSVISGELNAPASKSAMQRACAAAWIRKGKTRLFNPGTSADDKAALSIIKELGAKVVENADHIEIDGGHLSKKVNTIHCGESGLSARLFTSLAAIFDREITVSGSGSLSRRPFGFFDNVLPQLGVSCLSDNGSLPLKVQGPLKPADITIDGSLSSQFLTGLLFAYSAVGANGVSIYVEDLNSKPYIDLTIEVMKEFALSFPENIDYKEFRFTRYQQPRPRVSEVLNYHVESDWSGAAFLLVAGAINSSGLKINGLDPYSVQADRGILDALNAAGAEYKCEGGNVTINHSELQSFQFDATDCPDLFPPLVALAAFCNGNSEISGVHRLEHKESNRALTLKEEFGKLGVRVSLERDKMIITGGSEIKAAATNSHNDHRIAMALAIAALNGKGAVGIDGAEAVNKSYPAFWEHLQNCGGLVSLSDK